jgi:hypothetical protein
VAEALPPDVEREVTQGGLPGADVWEEVPDEEGALRQRAVVDTWKLCPAGATIKISFLGGTPQARTKVVASAREWMQHANLVLDFGQQRATDDRRIYQPGDGSHVRISFSRPGYCSTVGTDALSVRPPLETMSFQLFDIAPPPEARFRGVVLHEFGHMIGLSHEHQRPEARCDWDWRVIYEELSGPPNNWSRETIDHNMQPYSYFTNPDLRATAHDRASVMHYAFPARYYRSGAASRCYIGQKCPVRDGRARGQGPLPGSSARGQRAAGAGSRPAQRGPAGSAREGLPVRPGGGEGERERTDAVVPRPDRRPMTACRSARPSSVPTSRGREPFHPRGHVGRKPCLCIA